MSKKLPDFIKSEYFVAEPGNWHLKEGAPKQLQKELSHYIQSLTTVQDEPGTIDSIHVSYPYSE